MLLKAKNLELEAEKPIVILNRRDAEELDVKAADRVKVSAKGKSSTAIVNIAEKFIPEGYIGLHGCLRDEFCIKDGAEMKVSPAPPPESLAYIKQKLSGKPLAPNEMKQIIDDVVNDRLSDIEMTAFVAALHQYGMSMAETTALSLAMSDHGEKLDLGTKEIYDKHSVTWGTPVIVKKNGLKISKIGDFIDNIMESSGKTDMGEGAEYVDTKGMGYKVLAFDRDYKLDFRPLTGVYRHPTPREQLYEINLKGNRKIVATHCHSLFVLREGRILSAPTKNLRPGDFIAVPREIPENSAPVKTIDLVDELLRLPESETEGVFITGIEKHYAKRERGTQGNYGIVSFNTFRRKRVALPSDSMLRVKRGNNIPLELPVNGDLMKLLGYWTAEGYLNENGVHFSFGTHEKELIDEVGELTKKLFGLKATITHPHATAVHLNIYNTLLSVIFEKVLRLKKIATNKAIPDMVLNADKALQKEFLGAYFRGDGYSRRGYEIIAVTSSKELSTGIKYLLTLCGMSYSVSERPAGKRVFPNGYESETAPSSYIYTQSGPLTAEEGRTASFMNFLPLQESGLSTLGETNLWDHETRRVFRRQQFVTFKKLRQLSPEMPEGMDAKRLIMGNLGFLPIKNIRRVETEYKYVYDFCVEGYENFVAGESPICVHNSIGGIPGDKTSMLLVPIIASMKMTIPKTSSRAITAPAGTADRMECICPVALGIEEIKRVVKRTHGCVVWGGAVDLSPADDKFIQIEYPLSIDPLLLPSVMSKKNSVRAKYVAIDIPTGRRMKVKTTTEAEELAAKFIELGKRMGIKVSCVSTYGEQPIGHGIGPALEARELLHTIHTGRGPADLIDKVSNIASILFDFRGIKNGKEKALHIISSRMACKKFMEIVEAQGGDPNIKPEDIPVGDKVAVIKSNTSGKVWWVSNRTVTAAARAAGAPKDKGAGVLLYKKMGDHVEKGEKLLEIYAEKSYKLTRALEVSGGMQFMGVGKKFSMVLEKIPQEREHERLFILER